MPTIAVELDFRVREYIDKLTPAIKSSLERRMAKLAPKVADVARAQCPKRSGRLRDSIRSDTYSTRTGVWGKVTAGGDLVATPYAHFIETGFQGAENVKAHYRTIKQAFGRPIRVTSALIRAHARIVDDAADPFLRRALAEAEPAITNEITAAIDEALR